MHDFKPLFRHVANTSFPSTLTAYFAVVAAPMLFAWRRIGWVLVAITAEVASACVYVGVHYLTDVAAGTLLGGAFGTLAWIALGAEPLARAVGRLDGLLSKAHLRRVR